MRNKVTKPNRRMKKVYYQNKIQERKNDGNRLWKTLNEIMGRESNATTSFIEVDGLFLTKANYIANTFNDHFLDEVHKLRKDISSTAGLSMSSQMIANSIMRNNVCLRNGDEAI